MNHMLQGQHLRTEKPDEKQKGLLFRFGKTTLPEDTAQRLKKAHIDPQVLIIRHATGDWSESADHEKVASMAAITTGADRIISSYFLDPKQGTAGGKVWVITEVDRKSTLIYLPDDAKAAEGEQGV